MGGFKEVDTGLKINYPDTIETLSIPKRQWNRIKEYISKIKAPEDIFGQMAYTCVGITGSGVLTLLALHSSGDVSDTILITTYVITFCAAGLAISSFFMKHQHSEVLDLKGRVILDVMEDIELDIEGDNIKKITDPGSENQIFSKVDPI